MVSQPRTSNQDRKQNPEQQQDPIAWHAMPADQALQELQVQAREGLAADEARERLERHGRNRLREAYKRPTWKRFLDQFNNVLMIILIVAGVASLALGQPIDAGAIFGVVLIIALVGFIQEGKAEQALESIKNMLSPHAIVIRDGEHLEIDAEEVVPGDIVLIEGGDRIPADIRLIEARRFRTQEAALTGESEPVSKHSEPVDRDTDLAERNSMAFAGTMAVEGTARGLVVETGSSTELGRISEMLEDVETLQTPLLRHLDHAGKILAVIIVGAAALTAVFGVLVHGQPWTEMFMAAVGLAVASIPEGLPAIVTITLALGVQVMARRNAIIRKLPAVETLGSITTIFSDKTGTLTCNEMTAQAIAMADGEVHISGVGYGPEGSFHRGHYEDSNQDSGVTEGNALQPDNEPLLMSYLQAGVLCNDATLRKREGRWSITGDPTEAAFVVAAAKAGMDIDALRKRHQRLDAIPFESERKYMATLDREGDDGSTVIHVKGAPDRVIEMCDRVAVGQSSDQSSGQSQDQSSGEESANNPARQSGQPTGELDRDWWEEQISALSSRGLRVLAVARKDAGDAKTLSEDEAEHGLTLLGLIGLLDPPREAAVKAVATCLQAGIRPVMVTGDHGLTARAIADRLGLKHTGQVITGKQLEEYSDEDLRRHVREVDVFARAAPEHKLRLVQAAQANGEICAMTGDGVNDAPALKRADVGVAMGVGGTEVAKESAEMVLADDNFASIVNAVEEGRKVYDNIKKTITFILPTNGGQGLAIMVAVLAGTTLPVTPVQALWVNMVTAVTLGLALAFEPGERNLMHRAPRNPEAPLLDMFLLWRVVFVALLLLGAVYGMFLWIYMLEGGPVELARSGAVNMLVLGGAAYLINSRYLVGRSLSMEGVFGSRPVLIAIALVVVFQLLWTYTAPMQFLFDSASLGWHHWAVILAASVGLFLLVEAEKAVLRRRASTRKQLRYTNSSDL